LFIELVKGILVIIVIPPTAHGSGGRPQDGRPLLVMVMMMVAISMSRMISIILINHHHHDDHDHDS